MGLSLFRRGAARTKIAKKAGKDKKEEKNVA